MIVGFHLEWKQDYSHFGSEIEIGCGCVILARSSWYCVADAS